MAENSVGKTAIIVAVIGLIGTITVALISKIDFKTSAQSQMSASKPSADEPKIDTGIKDKQKEAVEIIFDDTRSKTEGESHDCLLETNFRKVTFIETQGTGPSKEYVMADENGKKEEYIINEDYLSKAAQIRLSQLKLGTHLTLKCMICKAREGGAIDEIYIVFMSV